MKINLIKGCLSVSNSNLNFKRTMEEHQSWGVRVESDKQNPSAKIFTYPDAKSVKLNVQNEQQKTKTYSLQNLGSGIFQAYLPKGSIKSGDRYDFTIQKADGNIETVKDPYSFKQPEISGKSEVYDQNEYRWNDSSWYHKDNSQKISRLAGKDNAFMPINNALIYEINVATLTQNGDFEGAKKELSRIKNLGFNAIELMPVENTYSYNWGYDGVDKFAVSNFLGGPDKLKDFIDEAHNVGLNVIMDMVPNHIGPDGAQLHRTGPYVGGSTPWGDALNYEGKDSKYVRDFIVNAALNWVQNYHCDGLRFDMTKYMNSDNTMQQIAAELNYHCPDCFLIAEDARSNISVRGNDFWNDWWQPHDERVINKLHDDEIGLHLNPEQHSNHIDKFARNEIPLARLGFDSEWDFHFYHTLTNVAYGEADLNALERAISDSQSRVKYSTSHDETGNLDGTRLVAKFMVPKLNLANYTKLQSDDVARAKEYVKLQESEGAHISIDSALAMVASQKVQQNSMKLAQYVQTGVIDEYLNKEKSEFEKFMIEDLGIDCCGQITPKTIIEAFEEAVKTYRAIEVLKYFTPGPLMTFQGEENLEMTKFNFFREFESIKDEYYLYLQKGYPHGLSAYQDSILGQNEYSEAGFKRMGEFENLIRDLNSYKMNNSSSTVGKIMFEHTIKHPQNPTIAMHAVDKNTNNETFVVANFSKNDFPEYDIEFPKGTWKEIINSNDEKYGGNSECVNLNPVVGIGQKHCKTRISLPSFSTVIFQKID